MGKQAEQDRSDGFLTFSSATSACHLLNSPFESKSELLHSKQPVKVRSATAQKVAMRLRNRWKEFGGRGLVLVLNNRADGKHHLEGAHGENRGSLWSLGPGRKSQLWRESVSLELNHFLQMQED
ncbi:UNVERIFIED_CONTAM: hypothetical protein K2H54_001844 [Gekko kuhli]